MLGIYIILILTTIFVSGYTCYFFGKKSLVKNELFIEYLVINSVINLIPEGSITDESLNNFKSLFQRMDLIVKELINEVHIQDKTYYGFNIGLGIECDKTFYTTKNFSKVVQQYTDLNIKGEEAAIVKNKLIANLRELKINSIMKN